MDWWEYGHESKECTCRFCGEDSDGDYCNSECQKAYESEN